MIIFPYLNPENRLISKPRKKQQEQNKRKSVDKKGAIVSTAEMRSSSLRLTNLWVLAKNK